jgi:ABC-type polysaccharide/polyol phosphate export permease
MPFTLPAQSVRNIMAKGYPFTDPSVLVGFAVVFIWTFAGIFLGLKGLQMKKYSRNS